ncbi:MAG: carboxypeptidase-like regulatory domain-containing protein, partial [Muribaculaceae bacterium]|nr:carboxypeptidase-like regulatory domain-containing protein [Muribaculaceae bacterium]
MMKRLLLITGALMLVCLSSLAAGNINCVGTVVDDQEEPIIGATVSVPGTSIGVSTDIDGRFSISAPE